MKNYYLIINFYNIIDNLYQVEQKQPIFSMRQTYVGPCLGVRFVFEIRREMGYFSGCYSNTRIWEEKKTRIEFSFGFASKKTYVFY